MIRNRMTKVEARAIAEFMTRFTMKSWDGKTGPTVAQVIETAKTAIAEFADLKGLVLEFMVEEKYRLTLESLAETQRSAVVAGTIRNLKVQDRTAMEVKFLTNARLAEIAFEDELFHTAAAKWAVEEDQKRAEQDEKRARSVRARKAMYTPR